jgi:DNA-binding MarR family transcriptional regulator
MDRSTNSINHAPGGLDQLDALLQHRARLGTMVLLSAIDEITFSTLRGLLKETDGNLGAQLRKLEEAEYIAVKKEFQDRKPVSWYSLTPVGRRALKRHLAAMETVVRSAGV